MENDWRKSAAATLARQRAAWIGTGLTLVPGFALVVTGGRVADSALGTVLLVIGIALSAIGMIWGSLIYMRVIDEQERDANLWATYVGMTVYFILYCAQFMARLAGTHLPIDQDITFFITIAVVLIVFVWKRFF